MSLIPKKCELDRKLNLEEVSEMPRPYLGLSGIGTECMRKLQLDHYRTYKSVHSARIKRLFGVGHRMEKTIVEDLARVGFNHFDDQLECIGFAGHWGGHIDGKLSLDANMPVYVDGIEILPGEVILSEFKTHNDKSFKSLLKDGVKKSKPLHYGQVQAYMGYFKLTKCLYVAYNKNDSTYAFRVIEFDQDYFDEHVQRKEREVVMSDVLLPKIGTGSITWFGCKFCDAKMTCHGKEPVIESCRTCSRVDILEHGRWECSLHNKYLSVEEQEKGCNKFQLADMFKG